MHVYLQPSLVLICSYFQGICTMPCAACMHVAWPCDCNCSVIELDCAWSCNVKISTVYAHSSIPHVFYSSTDPSCSFPELQVWKSHTVLMETCNILSMINIPKCNHHVHTQIFTSWGKIPHSDPRANALSITKRLLYISKITTHAI